MPADHDSAARHVLVVNQHGDNRGDEAALRAMLDGLEQRLQSVRFTVLHQFRDRGGSIDVPQSVTWMGLVLTPTEAVRIVVYTVLLAVRLRPHWLLGPVGQRIINAYETADVVVSAPGGPYLGDIYADHEPVHWAYIWLARLHRRPVVLYATSAGPFGIRWRRPFRRLTLRCIDRVIVREERSAGFLSDLMGADSSVEVTIDSAMQQHVVPLPRDEWTTSDGTLGDRRVLIVSAFDGRYGDDPDPDGRREVYDRAIVAAVSHIADEAGWHVVFVPQLHGTVLRDAPYLQRLGAALPATTSWEVLDEHLDSIEQRRRFAGADLVLAGRYHPAVFAVSAGVPVLCVPYEHKAAGLMEAAGLGDHVVPLEEVTVERLVDAIGRVWRDRDAIADRLGEVAPMLRALAGRTSDVVSEVVGTER